MRSGVLALAAVLAIGLAGVLALGFTRGSAVQYTLGVAPQGPVGKLGPGDEICQGVIRLPRHAGFERVGFYPRTPSGAATVEVTVRAEGGAKLGGSRARLDARTPALHRTQVGQVQPGQPLTVCFDNVGERPVELFGTAPIASPGTSATLNGKPANYDIGLTFERASERSLLGQAPDIARRMSVFHAGWVSPVTLALLAILVLIGIPLLLVVALRSAAARD
jgi:hypothetical protein